MLVILRQRLINMVVVLFAVVTVMFFLLHLAPASPVNQLPPTLAADPQAVAAYKASLGLNHNLFVQYWNYLSGLFKGDFGRSLYDHSSVLTLIAHSLPISLELGAYAAIGSMIPGVALGVWTAMRHGDWADSAMRIFTVLTLSVPAYWLAVLAMVFVGSRYPQLLPSAGGFISFSDDPGANLQVMFLPALVLGLGTFAFIARSLRSALVEVLSFDYVSFAAAMGMPRRTIMRRIAVRNGVIPTLTVMGVMMGTLISGTVLIESIFAIPGMGHLMVTAFLRGDYPIALGCSIITAIIFLGLNLIVDLLYYVVDPRIRARMPARRTRLAVAQ